MMSVVPLRKARIDQQTTICENVLTLNYVKFTTVLNVSKWIVYGQLVYYVGSNRVYVFNLLAV